MRKRERGPSKSGCIEMKKWGESGKKRGNMAENKSERELTQEDFYIHRV